MLLVAASVLLGEFLTIEQIPQKVAESIIDFTVADEPTGLSLVSTEVCVVDNVLTGAAGCPTE